MKRCWRQKRICLFTALSKIAAEVGLDATKIQGDTANPDYDAVIERKSSIGEGPGHHRYAGIHRSHRATPGHARTAKWTQGAGGAGTEREITAIRVSQ